MKTYTGAKLAETGTDAWVKEMVRAIQVGSFKYTPPKSFDRAKQTFHGKKQDNLVMFLASVGVKSEGVQS